MYLLIPFFLCCGLLCSFVSAGPSPQWLFEQIHALPGSDNNHVTAELHVKKSGIPKQKKRKDGVKRLFNFLDSAIKDSGSGSREGSTQAEATEEHSGSTGLTEKQVTKNEGPEQQEPINSRDSAKQRSNPQSSNENQVTATKVKTSFPVYHRLPGSSVQSTQVAAGQQRAYYAPHRTVAYSTYTRPRTVTTQTTYLTSVSPYARSMQRQQTAYGNPVTGQHLQSYDTASRRRPPAIPVRSQVTTNSLLSSQQSATTMQRFAGGLHRSNIQTPFFITTNILGPNQYVDAHGIPVAEGKSPEPLQEKPYGQLMRPRDQFHQQRRGRIPGRVPVSAFNRYSYPPPPMNFPGQVRAAIQPHFPHQRASLLASHARHMPVLQNPVVSSPSFSRQVYHRNLIPQGQAGLAFTTQMMRNHGYPVVTQAPVNRAMITRKPQTRNVLASLTAAAARLVVPARSEAYENSATAESIWSPSTPQLRAHAVRSNTHQGNVSQ